VISHPRSSDRAPRAGRSRVVIEYNEDTRQSLQGLLNDVPILEGMTEGDRALLADAVVMRWYEDGEYIVRQGEVGDKFCILMEGRALATQVRNMLARLVLPSPAVFAQAAKRSKRPSPPAPPQISAGTDKDQQLTQYVAGAYFGEIALLCNELRKASVLSSGPTKVRGTASRTPLGQHACAAARAVATRCCSVGLLGGNHDLAVTDGQATLCICVALALTRALGLEMARGRWRSCRRTYSSG